MSPMLLMSLAAAGQGDTFLLASSTCTVAKLAKKIDVPLIRLDGHPVSHILVQIMQLIKVKKYGKNGQTVS